MVFYNYNYQTSMNLKMSTEELLVEAQQSMAKLKQLESF
jgi:hypothetical protein